MKNHQAVLIWPDPWVSIFPFEPRPGWSADCGRLCGQGFPAIPAVGFSGLNVGIFQFIHHNWNEVDCQVANWGSSSWILSSKNSYKEGSGVETFNHQNLFHVVGNIWCNYWLGWFKLSDPFEMVVGDLQIGHKKVTAWITWRLVFILGKIVVVVVVVVLHLRFRLLTIGWLVFFVWEIIVVVFTYQMFFFLYGTFGYMYIHHLERIDG